MTRTGSCGQVGLRGRRHIHIGDLLGRGRDDIVIVFTGLLDGERMHEELFGPAEGQRETSLEMIDAVPVPALGNAQVRGSGMLWGDDRGAA